jgi:hypothetical protein
MNKYADKLKIAVFESKEKYSYQCIYTESEAASSAMVRITEWLETSFSPRLDSQAIVTEKVALIQKELSQVYANAAEKATKLREREKELLTLTYDPPVERVSSTDESFVDDMSF